MPTLRATTTDHRECLRVIDWCYDVVGFGHLVAAWCHREVAELRLNLPADDPRLMALLGKLWETGKWEVEVGGEPVRPDRSNPSVSLN